MPPVPGPIEVFQSRDHPGDLPGALTVARTLVKAIVAVSIPWMLLGLMLSLVEYPPLRVLLWLVPLLYLLAMFWTLISLQRNIVEIIVTDQYAALRSAWDVAYRIQKLEWLPVLGTKRVRAGLLVFLGDRVYELDEDEWPQFEEIKDRLRMVEHL